MQTSAQAKAGPREERTEPDPVTQGDAAFDAEVARAAQLHGSGRIQESRAACLQILRRAPDCAGALLLLGRIEAETDHLNIAERVLRRAVALERAPAGAAHLLAGVLVRRGEWLEALRMYGRELELDPDSAESRLERGRLHYALGRMPEAEADLRVAATRAPDRPHALDVLGVVLAQTHRGDEAVSCFERAIRARPGYAPAHDHLGEVHLAHGRLAQATRCFENALHHDAGLAVAHDHLGLALREQGRAADAVAEHARALELEPQSALYVAHRAQALAALGRTDDAEAAFRAVLALDPALDVARAGLAALMGARGECQQGLELVEAQAARPDASIAIRLACARLLCRVYRVADALAVLEPMVQEPARSRLTAAQRRALEFLLGDLHELAGQYPQAFASYERGNLLKPQTFDARIFQAQAEGTVAAFSAATLAQLPRVTQGTPELVFIVGLPRSGASLVQQVLASHPHAVVATSPTSLATVAQRLAARARRPWPACVPALDATLLGEASREFLAALPPRGVETRYVVQCVPADFAQLGLVELLFPRARIIHCQRDELDMALSCFAEDSVDQALAFSASLRGVATMTLAHRALMAHWRGVLRVPIYAAAYEALVTEPKREVLALTSFLGLTWHDACLRFHESMRAAAVTRGRARRPIYSTSIGRHRHYEHELEPLRELLAPQ